MPTNPVYGLVLSGGQSRRMGTDKALLQRNGHSQLSHMVNLLDEVVDRVFVSARSDQADDAERSQYDLILDEVDDLGPIAGILSALHAHPQADWLVVACDLPNIDQSTLEHLLQHRSTEQPFVAYRSSHDDLPEPLCALYSAASETLIRQFVDDGLVCPRKMLIRSDTLLLAQPNPQSLDNVNTPDDLSQSVLETRS